MGVSLASRPSESSERADRDMVYFFLLDGLRLLLALGCCCWRWILGTTDRLVGVLQGSGGNLLVTVWTLDQLHGLDTLMLCFLLLDWFLHRLWLFWDLWCRLIHRRLLLLSGSSWGSRLLLRHLGCLNKWLRFNGNLYRGSV